MDGAGEPHGEEGRGEEPKVQDLPPEVMDNIINYSEAPVLLQMRLVSPTLKTLVETSASFNDHLNNLEVYLNSSTLEEFVTSAPSLRFSRFSIDLAPPKTLLFPGPRPIYFTNDHRLEHLEIPFPPFYASPHFETFKQRFCPNIRRLRLSAVFCGTTDEELDFFKSLKVLEDLDIRTLRLLTAENSTAAPSLEFQPPRIPNFPKLKRLSIQDMEKFRCKDYLINWISICPLLVKIRLPQDHEASYILQLGSAGHLPLLQRLNLNSNNFEIQRWSPEELGFLRELTSRRNFKLEGVSMFLLSRVHNAPEIPPEVKRAFLSCITTSDELWEPLADLQNLEELHFYANLRSFTSSVEPQDLEMRRYRGTFGLPSLKKITGHVLAAEIIQGWGERMVLVFRHLLDRVFRPFQPRLCVTDMDINYLDLPPQDRQLPPLPPTFTADHLHLAFPNLKKLKFTLSRSAFDQMEDLFGVLSQKAFLEELHLVSFDGIPERAITGRTFPGLVTLERLKKLRLDTPFYPGKTGETMGDGILRVIAQMTLTHLHISGDGWTNVTGGGLRALSEGPLGLTILWTQLQDLGKPLEAEERREVFEGLSRLCHSNRFARTLTSVSFQQFQTSEAAFMRTEFPFRRDGWTDPELPPLTSSLGLGYSEGRLM